MKASASLKLLLLGAFVVGTACVLALVRSHPGREPPVTAVRPQALALEEAQAASESARQVAEPDSALESGPGDQLAATDSQHPGPEPLSGSGQGWRAPSDAIRAKYEHLAPEDFERAVRAVAEAYKHDQQLILHERLERGLFKHYVGAPTGPEDLPPTTDDMPMGAFGQWVIPRDDGLTETKTVVIPFGEYPEFEQLAQEHYWLSYWQRKREAPFEPFKH